MRIPESPGSLIQILPLWRPPEAARPPALLHQVKLVPPPPPPPPSPPPPPAPPPVEPPPVNPFGGVFRAGLPPLGITQHPVQEGDTMWRFLEADHMLPPARGEDPTRLVDAYLAGTPQLDTRAFGQRPANPLDAVRQLQPGDTVTVLDPQRLSYLEQQRRELAALEQSHPRTDSQITHHEDLQRQLVATVLQELDYAGTQQAVPSADALAAPIRARAPDDAQFKQAVDEAVALYRDQLKAQGRTSDALGTLLQHAQAGDANAVRSATREQLVALCKGREGPQALGLLVARGSVYMTYSGGDPAFASAVEQGIQEAEHTVLVDQPVQALQQAYDHGGAAEAMLKLAQITDPEHTTPGQVGQIMDDERTQQLVRRSLDDVARWNDPRGGPGQVMVNLTTGCEHALHSDGATPGIGRNAVDRIAGRIVELSQGGEPDMANSLFQYPMRLQNVLSNGDGQAGLALAVATKARAAGEGYLADAATAAAKTSLDQLASSTKKLNEQTAEHAAFLSVPASEWGAASTPAGQAECVKRLIAQNPEEAKKLSEDGEALLRQQERIESARTAVQAYQGPDAQQLRDVLHKLPAPAMSSTGESGEATNTLWFQRSLRKVVEMAGKSYLSALGKGAEPLLSPRAAQVLQEVWKRGHKTLGAALYFQNAAYELGEFGKATRTGALLNSWTSGASALRQELAGVSYALSAGIPAGRLAAVRPGSGATPLARSYADYAAKVDALALPDSAKLTLKQGLRLALQDSSDFASAILGVVSAAMAFHDGKNLQGMGQTLNAMGYTLMLTGSGIDEAVFAADATLMGMGATAWTGIGAALVLAGSVIYTAAEAYDHSHQYDGASRQWLEAMGVRQDIADPLARHATSLDGDAPTAGPFLSAYFQHNHLSQKDMVRWLNTLTPKDADAMASAIKTFGDEWKHHAMSENVRRFDDALLQYGLMPPDVKLLAEG